MSQEWFECKKYPGFSINKNGDLMNNSTGHLMKRRRGNDEVNFRYMFSCNGKTYSKQIKEIVAEQFIENPQNKKYVVNIDGNPENCCVDNLKWSNRKYAIDEEDLDENSKWYPMDNASNYEINKNGQVRHKIKGNILKPTLAKDGYLYYTLSNYNGKIRRYAAHVLVARQFLPNPDNKKVVNHIDENRQNCKLENLEWVSHKENSKHASAAKRIAKSKEKPLNEYDLDGNYIRTWKSIKAFYDFYDINASISHVSGCAKHNLNNGNNMQTAYGRIFTYFMGSTENITVSCSSKTLARATLPFENQNVTEEYLYKDESVGIKRIEDNSGQCNEKSIIDELKEKNELNELIIEQYEEVIDLLKKKSAEYEHKYEECLQEKNLYQQLYEQQKILIDMLKLKISMLER